MTAKTPHTRKAKGRRFQQDLRVDIIEWIGIDEGDILSTAMGQSGCDIYLSPAARERFPYGVEAKHQETFAIFSWLKQAETNAVKEGLIPLLVFKRNQMKPHVILSWKRFLPLHLSALIVQSDDRQGLFEMLNVHLSQPDIDLLNSTLDRI